MSYKAKVKEKYPRAYCVKEKGTDHYILFDDDTNPVFREGHKSAAKAWKDFSILIEKDTTWFAKEVESG